MTQDMREFQRSLPMSLMRAREAVMRNFTPALQAQNLSAQQWRVIRVLAEAGDGLAMSEVGERCFLLLPSLTRIAQNLESRGLIQRSAAESDQRRALLSLTEEGLSLFRVIAPQSEQRYKEITEKFGYGKLELLYELLDELVEKLEPNE
jgi:homoprotocatechuate degradation regulator HpaR